MDDILRIGLTILTTIITILLTIIANGVRNINAKQNEQETKISLIQQTLDQVVRWKSSVEQDEISHLREVVRELTKR